MNKESKVPGCESTNHDPEDCYGELWECSRCGKHVCFAEGTDNHPELCDDCWVEMTDSWENHGKEETRAQAV